MLPKANLGLSKLFEDCVGSYFPLEIGGRRYEDKQNLGRKLDEKR